MVYGKMRRRVIAVPYSGITHQIVQGKVPRFMNNEVTTAQRIPASLHAEVGYLVLR